MTNFQKGFGVVAVVGVGLSILGYLAWAAFAHTGNPAILVFAPYFLIFGLDDSPRLVPYAVVQAIYYACLALIVGAIWSTYTRRGRS